jgi:hypothetical protein
MYPLNMLFRSRFSRQKRFALVFQGFACRGKPPRKTFCRTKSPARL